MKTRILHVLILLQLSLVPYFAVTNAQLFDTEAVYLPTLSASSLDFELVHEDNTQIEYLFNLDWLKLHEPIEERIKVKNIGTQTFSYYPSFVHKGGERSVCESLRLTAVREGTQVYSGQLNEFTLPSLAAELTGDEDLWEFRLMHIDETESHQGQTCEFDIVFNSVGTGFSDTESVGNSVSLAVIPTLSAAYNTNTHKFSFTAGNLTTYSTFRYTLDYTFEFEGSAVGDHFEDTLTLSGESEKTIEKLLGTCSSECTYQQNPKDFKLVVEFLHSEGHSASLTKEL